MVIQTDGTEKVPSGGLDSGTSLPIESGTIHCQTAASWNDRRFIPGAGSDTSMYFGAILEFLLIVTSIGTAIRASRSSVAFTLDRYGYLYQDAEFDAPDRLAALLASRARAPHARQVWRGRPLGEKGAL